MRSIQAKKALFFVQAVCLTALSIPAALRAEELVISFDPAQTKIAFVVGTVLHTVHGTFQLKEGHISFDPSTGAVSGDVTADAGSGSSGNTSRDKRMTREIMEAQRYPEVRFSPTAYRGSVATTGTSNVEVTGSFLIHGQVHEITIPVQIQMSREEITAIGKFTVPYVQWGMKNPSNFLLKVDDRVEIDLTAIGRVNGLRAP